MKTAAKIRLTNNISKRLRKRGTSFPDFKSLGRMQPLGLHVMQYIWRDKRHSVLVA